MPSRGHTLHHPPEAVHLTRYTTLTLLALGLVTFLLVFDWNWFKGPVERRVSAATGREFRIEGNLHVRLGLTPTLTAEGLHFANAPWANGQEMASVDRIDVSIDLLRLFRREIELPVLHLERPLLLLERNRQGEANWDFGPADEIPVASSRWSWHVGQLVVDKGELRLSEQALDTDLRLQVRSAGPAATGARAPLVAEGRGRYRSSAFELAAKVDSPLDLRDRDAPYHIDLRVAAGATRAQVTGAIRGPIQSERFDVQFRLSGATLADLYRVVGVVLPETPPYALAGRLGREGTVWSYTNFRGTIGDSDLGGDVRYDTGMERPLLRGDLVSHLLDLDDLGGFLGATPGTGDGEKASASQKVEARKQAATGRVLPHNEYRLGRLRAMDADVRLRADRIEAHPLPLDRMTAHLILKDGLLTIDPLDFSAAGGTLAGRVTLDARQDPIATKLDVRASRLQLQKLFPSLKAPGVGLVGGHLGLEGKGNSVAQMLATSDGEFGAVMGQGKLSNLILELAGLDVAEALKFLLGKDRMVTVRCAYIDLQAQSGIYTVRGFALDTTDTVLLGEGSVDMRDEKLALRLKPRPKDMSPVTLRGPLRVGGSFKDPSILPEPAPLALRAAAAAALFAIAPPAALLALIETGPGEDTNCAKVNAAADPRR